jgi:DNA-binding winged helix-turn-helix (wHTH) protein
MAYPVFHAGPFDMATNEATQAQRRASSGWRDPDGRARWFLKAPFRKEAWLALIYLLVSFPVGIAAFVYGVTMLSLGVGLIVLALVGIPLLIVFMYSLQPYGELERSLSNKLLGTRIPPLYRGEPGDLWSRQRLVSRLKNPLTWRLLAFMFVRFAVCIAGFVVAVTLVTTPVSMLAAPISTAAGGDVLWADTTVETIPFVVLSPLALVLAFNGLHGAGVVNAWFNRLFLETQYAGVSDEGPTVLERAKAAAGAWSNPGAPVVLDDGNELVAPTLSAAAAPAAQTAPPAEAEEGLMVDVAMRRVRVNGRPVELTPKEFDLLALFAQNPGRPFSRDDLLDRIWKNDYEVTDRTIDTHVQRLRKKLGNQAGVIQTVWGVGYRFEESRATATGRGEPGTEGEAPPQGW